MDSTTISTKITKASSKLLINLVRFMMDLRSYFEPFRSVHGPPHWLCRSEQLSEWRFGHANQLQIQVTTHSIDLRIVANRLSWHHATLSQCGFVKITCG